jgi:hypothetical protein
LARHGIPKEPAAVQKTPSASDGRAAQKYLFYVSPEGADCSSASIAVKPSTNTFGMHPWRQKIDHRNPSGNSTCQVSALLKKIFSDRDESRVEKLFGDFIAPCALRKIAANSAANLRSEILETEN